MTAELKLDLAKLPKPRKIDLAAEGDLAFMTLDFGSIRSARAWARVLGVAIVDLDVDCRYITVRQESGAGDVGGVRVHIVGTESVPIAQWPKRQAIQAEAQRRKKAEASKPESQPVLVNGTYFADDAPDPDLARADAVWHREHPTDCCPNQATCVECRTGVA